MTGKGLIFDYNKYHLADGGKDTVEFWQKLPSHIGVEASKIIIVDDFEKNCEMARKAGLAAIEWVNSYVDFDGSKIRELDDAMKGRGYKA